MICIVYVLGHYTNIRGQLVPPSCNLLNPSLSSALTHFMDPPLVSVTKHLLSRTLLTQASPHVDGSWYIVNVFW